MNRLKRASTYNRLAGWLTGRLHWMLCVAVLGLWTTAAAQESQVAVIAHKDVPLDTLDKADLLDLYTGDEKFWDDDAPVVVLDLKPKGEVKEAFYRFLGKSPSRMKSIWMRKMLSGEGDPPAALATEKDIVQKVATTPGAIGFVGPATVSTEVKTLLLIHQPSSGKP